MTQEELGVGTGLCIELDALEPRLIIFSRM